MSRERKVAAMLQATKIILLVLLSIALGLAVLFCVTRVGDLNGHAAVLQACITQNSHVAGCPLTPISQGQIASLHNEADTLGNLGWIAFLLLIFSVGGTALDVLTD